MLEDEEVRFAPEPCACACPALTVATPSPPPQPRVKKVHASLYQERKAIHFREFAKLLEAPSGYLLENPNMHAFHTIIADVRVRPPHRTLEAPGALTHACSLSLE